MAIIEAIQQQPTDRLAVRIGALDISYGRLVADVAAAAAQFAAQGVTTGSKLGLRAGNLRTGHSYPNWVAHLASIRLGATHVSIMDQSSLAAALQSGMIDTIIGPQGAIADAPAVLKRMVFDLDPTEPLTQTVAPPDQSAAAVRLNLTSGTVGSPKFVSWNSKMIDARVAQIADGLPIGPDTFLYPLLHIRTTAGFRYPLAVWHAGGCVLLPDDPEVCVRDEALGQSTLIPTSPVQLAERVRKFTEQWAGRDARTIVVLGGRLPPAIRDEALGHACANLLVGYGSTETGSIALGPAAMTDRHGGAVGFVRNGVTVEIVDNSLKPVAAGEPGAVRIKREVMSPGYISSAVTTETSQFEDGFFYPGDIGRLFKDGLLAIEGRASETLNVGGWKVSAPELESKLSFLPGVDDLAVCVMQLAEGDLLTIALVTRDSVDLRPIAELIQSKLPQGRHFHLVRVQSIPRNAMGKIPRAMIANKLTALFTASQQNGVNA